MLKKRVEKLLCKRITKGRVIFESNGFYDNGYALFCFAKNCRPDLEPYFFCPSGVFNGSGRKILDVKNHGRNLKTIFKRFRLFRFLSSCETFFGSYTIACPNQKTKAVYVSHGFSLKKASEFMNSVYLTGCDIVYPSLELERQFRTQFLFNSNRVVICGQGRSDKCVFSTKNSAFFNQAIKKMPKEKVLLALITFRRNKDGGFNPSFIFPDYISLERLDVFLHKHHLRLVIKLHHVLDNADISSMGNYSNIVCLKNSDLFSRGLETVSVVPYADAFLSDYSGGASDCMMADKPIGFFCGDLATYAAGKNEGFTFEDPLAMMPGDHILSQSDLEAFLLDVAAGVDKHRKWRRSVSMIMNGFVTPPCDSCKRLLNIYYPRGDQK